MDDETLLRRTVALSDAVVLREFPDETIVLQLDRQQYHGLNATAAIMLSRVQGRAGADVVEALAAELDAAPGTVRADLVTLLRGLADRAIVTLEP